jgi:phage baseplate assembly protein W
MTDELGVQSWYLLTALDEFGAQPSQMEFAGVHPAVTLRMAPQALQIQRNIRAEVLKDLGRGISIVTGGEGLGRITIQGTHGVGPFVDAQTPSLGKQARDRLIEFFSAFVTANDERGRTGRQGLRMVWRMVGGGWSNPQDEAYLVWPESFPTDTRSVSRPHAWDWAVTLTMLAPFRIEPSPDPAALVDPDALVKKADALDSLLGSATQGWMGALSVLQDVRDLRSKLALVRGRIKDFTAGSRDAVYQVTDLVRGSAQLCSGILQALSVADFQDDAKNAIRGTIYEVRQFLGDARMAAEQFRRSGAVQSTLTARRTTSLNRPVFVALSPGDSLQAIASRVLGDAARWVELVTVNQLDFPYVDFSGPGGAPGGAYAGLRVLGATATLKLPLPASPGVIGVADDPIGTDTPDLPAHAGDLQGGTENMVAALLRRLLTPRGRIPWHPSYGSGLKAMIGSASDVALVMAARADVVDSLQADPRVLGVNNPVASFVGNAVEVSAEVVTPLGTVTLSGSVS